MQHSFKSFIEAVQTAVVQSSEAISKRNEKIIEDYFFIDDEEVLLENGNYNKELFDIIKALKENIIFTDSTLRGRIFENFEKVKEIENVNDKSSDSLNIELNDEDKILHQIFVNLVKSDATIKISKITDALFLEAKDKLNEQTQLVSHKQNEFDELVNNIATFKVYLEELNSSTTSINEEKIQLEFKLKNLEDALIQFEAWRRDGVPLISEHVQTKIHEINALLGIEKTYNNLPNYITKINSSLSALKKEIHGKSDVPSDKDEKIKKILAEIDQSERAQIALNLELDKVKKELEHFNKIANESAAYSTKIQSAIDTVKTAAVIADELGIVKNSDDLNEVEAARLITSIKRYKRRSIETYVPKTVRINYPATFDFATPDNEKDYKVVSTPIEVPLLTLVPISTCNIEKATLKANFKFDMVGDEVKVDFTNDKFKENETAANFGSLEIVLSPSQTPEGLKAMIETYENFLKRQII